MLLAPLDVLKAVTSRAAALVGLGGRAGTIAPGAFADLVAFDGDVTADLARLQRPLFVMKDGRVVVQR